ncbi:MAG: hypothetical protein H8E26_15830 [FCB group bacterium]|nr:hypothetical protein [FCB group bacterium]MBL7028362.1 hypothetical protein [Candidatus Neomarinimicrobiota bacterium]MBL7121293.1 hypothetical protein [Candidatus Neomarinimicrobiota bacterium]
MLSKDSNSNTLVKPSTVEYERFEGNNISNWMDNQGALVSVHAIGNGAGEWPAGSGKGAIFHSGIWVIGKIDNEISSAVAEYRSEWTPGSIPYDTQTQLPTSDSPPNTTDHQIYYISHGNSSDPLSENYNREYATWPVSDGAPAHDGEYFTDLNGNELWETNESFEDFNRNGSYDAPDGLLVTGEDPPLFIGDTQAWYVMNDWDTTAHHNMWRTVPLGLESQVLIYTRSDDPIYENVQFQTVTLINKGGQTIDDAYYGYFIDCDIGSAHDDYAGCDTSLSLGYSYNGRANDRDYGQTPPAVGYDFLQGPMIESMGDTVWNNNIVFTQRRKLEMTSFELFRGGSARLYAPSTALEAYNYMQGLTAEGEHWHERFDDTQPVTNFLYPGDPVTGNGWTEYDDHPVGDRASLMSTGPFAIAPWDDMNSNSWPDFGEPGVQVIHSAVIIVDGVNHLDAVTNLKYVSRYVQNDFDHGFENYAMEMPRLSASSHDQEIVLNWYEGADEYETIATGSYEFEGYNLYQGASIEGPWTRLATYDLINNIGAIYDEEYDDSGFLEFRVVQEGTDSGLEHLVSIQEDALNDEAPLINNKEYYFALSAYAYSESALPHTIESIKHIHPVRPHKSYTSAGVRDTLEVEHNGQSEVLLTVDVLDPGQLTGLNYKLGFEYDSTEALARWHVTRRSVSFQDTATQSDWTDIDWYRDRHFPGEKVYIDGFDLSIDDISFQPPAYKKHWEQIKNVVADTSWVESFLAVSPGGVDSLMIVEGDTISLIDFLGPLEHHWDSYVFFIREEGTQTWFDIPREESHNVSIQAFASHFGAQGGDRLADIPGIGGGSNNLEFLQSDLELHFTGSGQIASKYDSRTGHIPELTTVPFEVWDMERDRQLCVAFLDTDTSGVIQDTSKEDWEHTLGLDWVIVFDRDYATYGTQVDSFFDNPYSGWCWQFDDESKFSIGDVVSIQFLNPVKAGVDVYSWSTEVAGTAYDEDALDLIQIFPNPYFGYQSEQSSFSEPYVTMSNLPEQACTIRIYSLGGTLVRRFDHEVGTYEYWDLLNEHRWPVASGVYIVHIEVPDLGNKILKVAVFQPER